MPGFPTELVDSTGAGDAFMAALLVSLRRGVDLEEAVTHACAAGEGVLDADAFVVCFISSSTWLQSTVDALFLCWTAHFRGFVLGCFAFFGPYVTYRTC